YLVRLLNNNSKISVAEIADHFNLTEKDICRAIKYWISRDVLKLNYDGKGHLNGIVLLPLHNPKNELNVQDTDIISFLRDDTSDDESGVNSQKNEVQSKSSNTREHVKDAAVIPMPSVSTNVEYSAPPKAKFSKEALEDVENDDDWMDILYQVETIFGKTISSRDMQTLLYIYDSLNFDVDLFEYLIEYCATMGKKNCRYMEAVAISWYKDGIKTRQEAKEQSNLLTGIAKTVFKSIGVRSRIPTSIELAYITTWTKDYGFSEEIVKTACDKAILSSPNSVNFAYINAILENWNKNGVHTKADIERLDKEFIKNKTNSSKAEQFSAKVVNGFNNFEQKKLDDELDEMEKLFLNEVNKK
ncbi:MAG: DnaD domain protein, partial [Lachnospiraceae bacterium]|nr:DnaD domain protein [Lachnospiraceae bacterium]